MANAAVSLLNGEYDLEEFRANAHTKAHEKFGADKIVDHYERYYRQVMEDADGT